MEEFNPLEEEDKEFDVTDKPASTVEVRSLPAVKEEARLVEEGLGVPAEEAERKLVNGMRAGILSRAEQLVKQYESQSDAKELDEGLSQNLTLEQMSFISDNSLFGGNLAAPTEALLISDTEFGKQQRKAYRRAMMLSELAYKNVSEASTGTGDIVGEFADLLITGTISEVFFGATTERNELAQTFNNLLFSNLSDQEVMLQADEFFKGMADQGLFTDESSIYLQMFLDQAVEMGVGARSFEDDFFRGLDVAGVVAAAPGQAGRTLLRAVKAGNAINTVAKLRSSERAAGLARRAIRTGDDTAKITENSSSSALQVAKRDPNDHTGVGVQVADEIEGVNSYHEYMTKSARFTRVLDEDQLAEVNQIAEEAYRADMAKGSRKKLLDFDTDYDEFGNLISSAFIGTAKGNLFPSERAAQKVADKVGGVVEPDQVKDGKIGWAVRVDQNVSQTDKVRPTDIRQVASSFFSKLFSSTARTTENLDAVIKIDEGQSSRMFKEIGRSYTKARRSTSRAEISGVDKVLFELNNDPKKALRTSPYTTTEFKAVYENLNGAPPSAKAVDFYLEQLKMSDFTYRINADLLIKRAVENGERMYKIENSFKRGKVAREVESTTPVWDETSKSFKEYKDFEEGTVLQLMDNDYLIGDLPVQFVHVGAPVKRLFKPSDVLGYNAGGPRTYTAKFFIKQERDVRMAGGQVAKGTPRTFMGVVTEKEARLAETQINNIVAQVITELDVKGPITKELIKERQSDLLKSKALQKAIEDNNDWNVGIATVDDFLKFANEWNLNITRKVDFAPDGEQLLGARSSVGSTVGEDFFIKAQQRRGNKPLLGFGGDMAETLDPTTAIERSTVIALNRFANYSYTQRAIGGWLKAATDTKVISNLPELQGLSNIEKMRKAKLSETLVAGKKLAAERNFIESRLQYKTTDMQKYDQFVNGVADFVYDKGAKKVSRNFRDAKDPFTFMRSMAFNMKLGLFAVDQLFVQASQIVNIVGVSGQGFKGALNVVPLRMALVAPDNETVRTIARRIASVTGVSEDEFVDMVKWVRESGRDIVDQNIAQLDGNQTLYKTTLGKMLDAGRIPFNEGELLARLAGMSSSFLEYRKKFPDADVFSDSARKWMTRRQDILTASMTSGSSATWQRGVLGVPTQFMTYSMRMMEQMFIPGILTPKERIKLAGAQTIFWGGVGIVPYSYFFDKTLYENGVEMDPEVYDLVRYGAVDYLLSNSLGTDTDLSSRLGAVGGITSLIENMMESSVLEFAFGPSGSIATDAAGSVYTLASNMFQGKFDYTSYDWQRLGRNITSVNRVYNAWVADQQGEYLNRKNGEPTLTGLGDGDTFAIALGIPLKENTMAFTLYDFQTQEKELIKEHGNKMREMRRIMIDYLDKGDRVAAQRVSDDIAAMYNVLTPYNKEAVMRMFNREERGFLDVIVEREIEAGRTSVLKTRAQEMLNEKEE